MLQLKKESEEYVGPSVRISLPAYSKKSERTEAYICKGLFFSRLKKFGGRKSRAGLVAPWTSETMLSLALCATALSACRF